MSALLPPTGDTPEAPDMAAAELALGVLDGAERAAAMRRVLAEPGFARAVERWRQHLSQLFDLWPAVPAPEGVWQRVEQSLDPAAPAAVRSGRFWPALAALSSLAAAVLLVLFVARPTPVAPPPVASAPAPELAAAIAPTAGAQATPVAAVYNPGSGGLRLTAASLTKAGRDAELWVIAGDGVPHSLGLLRVGVVSTLTIAPGDRARLVPGVTLAVTIEPAGGSPTGLPTGPVVATGALSRV